MAASEQITGYSDFAREDGRTMATAHYADGSVKRCEVRVAVEREHRDASGELVASGEVASSDDGSVRVAEGASL